jgi:hypothetical protein
MKTPKVSNFKLFHPNHRDSGHKNPVVGILTEAQFQARKILRCNSTQRKAEFLENGEWKTEYGT